MRGHSFIKISLSYFRSTPQYVLYLNLRFQPCSAAGDNFSCLSNPHTPHNSWILKYINDAGRMNCLQSLQRGHALARRKCDSAIDSFLAVAEMESTLWPSDVIDQGIEHEFAALSIPPHARPLLHQNFLVLFSFNAAICFVFEFTFSAVFCGWRQFFVSFHPTHA